MTRSRRILASLVAVVGTIGLLSAPGTARAEPYLAVQMGFKCAQCHVNPTGGGLRNIFGNAWAQTQLATRRLGPEDDLWNGMLGKYLAIGGNLRGNYATTRVPDQATTNGFDLQEARIYLDAAVIPNRLSIYLDERVGPGNAQEQEANVRLWLREGSVYLKAGQFYLPFGWRLEDDNAYVRQLSGINMQTPDRGVEIGLEQGQWSAQLSVSNGTAGGPEVDDGKQISTRVEYVPGNWRIGASATVNNADAGDRTGLGLFGGLHWREFALLGEVDYFDDDGLGSNGRKLLASFVEANWRVRQGHNVKLSYEWFEPDRDVDEDEQTRTSLLYEWSPFEFVQARFGFRYFHGIPQNDLQNRSEAFVQLHGYF